MISTAYSQLYWILNRFVDHAFNQTIPSTQAGTFLYFSMVTLTSVGYGGIAPLNPYVRIVAALESMSGSFSSRLWSRGWSRATAQRRHDRVSLWLMKLPLRRRSPSANADASKL